MVRPHPGVDQLKTFVVDEKLVNLYGKAWIHSTDPVDPIGYFVDLCH